MSDMSNPPIHRPPSAECPVCQSDKVKEWGSGVPTILKCEVCEKQFWPPANHGGGYGPA